MTVDLKLGEAQLTYRNCQWTSFMLDAFVTTTRLNEVVFDKLTKYVNACHNYQPRRYSMATATACI
jgi:hypothetical protein